MDYKIYKKSQLLEFLKEKDIELEDLQYELDRLNEAYCELENSIVEPTNNNFDIKHVLRDIIRDVENKYCGRMSYRKLDTEQDIINCIKQECLGGINE